MSTEFVGMTALSAGSALATLTGKTTFTNSLRLTAEQSIIQVFIDEYHHYLKIWCGNQPSDEMNFEVWHSRLRIRYDQYPHQVDSAHVEKYDNFDLALVGLIEFEEKIRVEKATRRLVNRLSRALSKNVEVVFHDAETKAMRIASLLRSLGYSVRVNRSQTVSYQSRSTTDGLNFTERPEDWNGDSPDFARQGYSAQKGDTLILIDCIWRSDYDYAANGRFATLVSGNEIDI